MEFVYYDLGYIGPNKTAKITVDRRANVILLDEHNFQNYKKRLSFRYIGGETKGQISLSPSHSAHWYAVIDLGGREGTIKSSCRVIEQQ